MTGNQLKTEIKKSGLTQEAAAEKLGITRATLSNWCKQADLPVQIIKNVKAALGLNVGITESNDYLDVIKSQQRTIELQAEVIKTLTSK